MLGGDDGIRLSRELRAQSFAGKTRPPEEFFTRLLLRIPLFILQNSKPLFIFGGDDGIRTHDPLLAGQVLSQLSYTPILNGL